jgi:hypothetical protein
VSGFALCVFFFVSPVANGILIIAVKAEESGDNVGLTQQEVVDEVQNHTNPTLLNYVIFTSVSVRRRLYFSPVSKPLQVTCICLADIAYSP